MNRQDSSGSLPGSEWIVGGGEMGALMRAHDWSTSPAGKPEGWPQSLRSAVGLMLANKHIMFVAWGPELAFLYNDAYRPVFGQKHPWALGRPFREVWSEVWDKVEPLVNAALAGEATWSENLHLVLERNGYPEDCWFTFSYSPVRDEGGAVVGLFCAATETTGQVLAERKLLEDKQRQRLLFEKAPGFIAILTGPEHVFEFVNYSYVRLASARDYVGRSAREVFPKVQSQGLLKRLDDVYATGERFVGERLALTLRDTPDQPNRDVVLDFVYEPIRDEAGAVTGIFIEGHDVTVSHRMQVALHDSEERYHALFAASPVPFMVVAPDAPDFTITAANDAYFAATLTTPESLVGRKLFDVFPDDPSRPGQLGSEALAISLNRVLTTRTTDTMERMRYDLVIPDGGFEPHWWEAINAPMLDASGEVSAIIHQVTRVSELHYREEAELQEQERKAFLLKLSDALRAEPSAEAITNRALRMLSEQMRLDRCYVGIYRLTEDIGDFPHQVHNDHLTPLPAQVRLSDFPKALQVALDRTLVMNDAVEMEGLSDSDRASLDGLGLGALIAATLRKGENNPLWALVAASTSPRCWTPSEISLVEEVAERTWAAVERARAEGALGESETLLSAVLEALPVGVILTDAKGCVIRENAANRVLWGVPPETTGFEQYGEWVGWWPETGERIKGTEWAMARALLHGETVKNELIENQRFGTGERRFILNNAAPVRDASGTIVGGVVAQMDITKRLAAETAVRELYDTLEQQVAERTADRDRLWQSSQDLLMIARFDGSIVTVNPAWAPALGWSQAEMMDMQFWTLIHPDDVPACQVHAIALSTGGQTSARFECRYRAKSGAWRWLAWSATSGASLFNGVARDVTEDKARQAELEQAQAALRQSQKMEAMGQLTGGVAHDFNNLLTPVILGLEMLRRSHDDARSQKLIGGALQSAERAKTLIQRLLTFARRQALEPIAVDPATLLNNLRELIDRSLGPTIKVVVKVADDLPAGMIDPNQLELAILNLSVNARDAMPDGGTLTIGVTSQTLAQGEDHDLSAGRYICFSISDSGCGMDNETLARCVEPFFTTKEVGQGTGLGLAMVHGLAAQSGGVFRMTSQPGVGTQASLWVPTTDQIAADLVQRLPAAPIARRSATLLLVDDEELVRGFTAEGLRSLGYDVVEAASAAKALDHVVGGLKPDLVVTDHMMPGMTGAQLAAKLREITPSLPVLMITGYASMTPGQTLGLEFLAKPFGQIELAARVASMLEGVHSESLV